MTRAAPWCLDWRSQFAELKPYFEGRGGVIHVHAGSGSAVSAFARAVRSKLAVEEWTYPWSSVQIDPSNANTHYVPDIVQQIIKNSGLTIIRASQPNQQPIIVSVGSEIDAGGDVVVRDIDIAFPYDEYGKAMREGERITQLCDSLREVLATRRVALVFVDTHESDAQSLTDLGRKLWEGALAELTDSGLLVIDIFDPGALAGKSSAWPPDPCLVLELPDRYDHDSRADALEDLASIALREGWFPTFDEARASAMTILAVSDNIRDVYAGLAAAVVRLGVGTGVRK